MSNETQCKAASGAEILDALGLAEFVDALAELVSDRVADKVNTDLEMFSMQSWYQEYVHPAWSGYCWHGEHDQCNGTAPPADRCHCPCHRGEPVAEHGYVLEYRERTLQDGLQPGEGATPA